MYFEEHNPVHFNWLMVDNADQSVFAFEREAQGEVLVFVYNMTPNYYEFINIPLLHEGKYEEILNTDKDVYGGANQYNGLPCEAFPGSFEGKPYHMTIKLGSFAACIFKRINEVKEEPVKKAPIKKTTKK